MRAVPGPGYAGTHHRGCDRGGGRWRSAVCDAIAGTQATRHAVWIHIQSRSPRGEEDWSTDDSVVAWIVGHTDQYYREHDPGVVLCRWAHLSLLRHAIDPIPFGHLRRGVGHRHPAHLVGPSGTRRAG